MTPEEIATRAALAAAATTTAAEAAERALRDADKPLAELQPRPHLEKARELLAGEYERGGLTEYQFITGKGNYDNDPEIRAIEAALALTADINSELEARLAASEARDKVRREALEFYSKQLCEGIGECVGDGCGKLTEADCVGCKAYAALAGDA